MGKNVPGLNASDADGLLHSEATGARQSLESDIAVPEGRCI